MISLKLARKLKDAGLKPECADFELFWLSEVEEIMHVGPGYEPEPEDVWLPRVDTLLAEIERRGYRWHLYSYKLPINGKTTYACEVMYGDNTSFAGNGYNPNDATAQALLEILEREKEANHET